MSPESHPSYTDDDRDTDAALAGLRNFKDFYSDDSGVIPVVDRGGEERLTIPISIAQRQNGSWVIISRTPEIEGYPTETVITDATDETVQSVLARQPKQ